MSGRRRRWRLGRAAGGPPQASPPDSPAGAASGVVAGDASAVEPAPPVPGVTPIRLLGVGRLSGVWLAREDRLGRTVALKVMAPLPDADAADRVAEGYRPVVAATARPGLGTVHDVLTTGDGRVALVAEPLLGGGLAAAEEAGRQLTVLDVVHLGKRLAAGLQALHDVDRLHLDVRPANLLLDRWRRPRLVDAGLSQLWRRALGIGWDEDPVGVLAYCPPELLAGEELTPRTDVYALAATMTGLLAGHGPFLDRTVDAAALRHLVLGPDIPDLRPRGLPDPLWELLHSAMQPDPAHRPPTAAAFGTYLASFGRLSTWAAGGEAAPRLLPPPASTRGLSSRSGRTLADLRPGPSIGQDPAPIPEDVEPVPADPDATPVDGGFGPDVGEVGHPPVPVGGGSGPDVGEVGHPPVPVGGGSGPDVGGVGHPPGSETVEVPIALPVGDALPLLDAEPVRRARPAAGRRRTPQGGRPTPIGSRRRTVGALAGGALLLVVLLAAVVGSADGDRPDADPTAAPETPLVDAADPTEVRPTVAPTRPELVLPPLDPTGPPAPATPSAAPTALPLPVLAGAGLPDDGGALVSPVDLVVDDGVALVADVNDHRVHRVAGGRLLPLLGTGVSGGDGDGGDPLDAQVAGPSGLAMGEDGALHVAERLGNRIRVVRDGSVETLVQLGPDDPFQAPLAVAVVDGRVFASSTATDNVVAVEAGSVREVLPASDVANPVSLAAAGGELLVLDAGRVASAAGPASAPRLLLLDPGTGAVRPVSGLGELGNPRDVVVVGDRVALVDQARRELVDAELDVDAATASDVRRVPLAADAPTALAAVEGAYLVADPAAPRLLRVDPLGGEVRALVAEPPTCEAGVPAEDLVVRALDGVVVTPAGTTLLTDVATGCIAEVGRDGRIVRAIRPALPAGRAIGGLAVDDAGRIYLSDSVAAVYRLDGEEPVRIAGTGERGRSTAAGPADAFALAGPLGLDWHAGVLYVADSDNVRVVAVQDGQARPVVGAEPTGSFFVDGPAEVATFAAPVDVAADDLGLLVVDRDNHAVRRVLWPDGAAVGGPGGVVATLVGTGEPGLGQGNVALATALDLPRAVVRSADGSRTYVVDAGNGVVHRIDADGALATVFGRRPPTGAPRDVALTPDGDLLVTDRAGRRAWVVPGG